MSFVLGNSTNTPFPPCLSVEVRNVGGRIVLSENKTGLERIFFQIDVCFAASMEALAVTFSMAEHRSFLKSNQNIHYLRFIYPKQRRTP